MLLTVLATLGGPVGVTASADGGGARGGAGTPTAAGGADTPVASQAGNGNQDGNAQGDGSGGGQGNGKGQGNGVGAGQGNGNGGGGGQGNGTGVGAAGGGARGGGSPGPTGAGGTTPGGGRGRGRSNGSGSAGTPACGSHCQGNQGSTAQATVIGVPVIQNPTAPTTTAPTTTTAPVATRTPVSVVGVAPARRPAARHRPAHRSSDPRSAGGSGLTTPLLTGPSASAGLLTAPRLLGTPQRFGGFGPINAPLPKPVAATSGRLGQTQRAVTDGGSPRPAIPSTNVISRIEQVVPDWVWLGIGAALLVAFVAGGSALWNARRVQRQNERVAEITAAALSDPLTGALNRRGFLFEAERELARAERHERPFTLAYTDVRGLKPVNDTLGHRSGDRLLRSVAELLRDNARAGDAVGRLGGDEFGLLLVEQDAYGADAVAIRIQAAVSAQRRALALDIPWDLTIGLATYPDDGDSIPALLQRADERLYRQRGITVRSR